MLRIGLRVHINQQTRTKQYQDHEDRIELRLFRNTKRRMCTHHPANIVTSNSRDLSVVNYIVLTFEKMSKTHT